jgi:mono/diheme cytochrome c family protein
MLSRNHIGIAAAILGCFALWTSCGKPNDATFNEDIAPILYKHCVSCHRPDGAAPFSLLTYKEAWKKKKTILKVTKSGYMPPWPADPAYAHFLGEKFLSEEEKSVIENRI